MSELADFLAKHVRAGRVPGAVAVHHREGVSEIAVAGVQDRESGTPMRPDSLFAIASITKPITAAAVLLLVQDGLIDVDAPVREWLPELAEPRVLRDPSGPLDQTVPAERAITVRDLLTFGHGLGMTPDFDSPLFRRLVDDLDEGTPFPTQLAAEEWMARAGRLPLAHQPGRGWTYNVGSVLQGILVTRVSAQSFEDFLAERIFGPLGMRNARFWVPVTERDRFTTRYRRSEGDELVVSDPPEGRWSTPPGFAMGSGGLVCTAADWLAFGLMLLHGGTYAGRRVLREDLVEAMMRDQVTTGQRQTAGLFLSEDQGWGFGGSTRRDGSYGWDGGTGTSARVNRRTGQVTILLSQVEMQGPVKTPLIAEFERITAI